MSAAKPTSQQAEEAKKAWTPSQFLATFRNASLHPATDEGISRQTIADVLRGSDAAGEGTEGGNDRVQDRHAAREREEKALTAWAKANGMALYSLPGQFQFNSALDVGGVEHHVWFDNPSQEWLKVTKPTFGVFPTVRNGKWTLSGSKPSEYLEKLDGLEEFSGVKTTIWGVLLDRKDAPSFIVSQPTVRGNTIGQEKIDQNLRETGFLQIDGDTHYRLSDNFAAFDAHPGNLVEGDNRMIAFDGVFIHPQGELKALLEWDYAEALKRKPAPENATSFMDAARQAGR